MPAKGEKSGEMVLWMAPGDEQEFGSRVRQAIAGSAQWQKMMPGFQVGPRDESLGALLTHQGDGADLRLNTGGPIIQYVGGWLITPGSPVALPGESVPVLTSASLAFRWSPEDQSAKHRSAFEKLAKTVFGLMRECTLPSMVLFDGKPYRSSRIGKAALAMVSEKGIELRDSGARVNRLELRAPKTGSSKSALGDHRERRNQRPNRTL